MNLKDEKAWKGFEEKNQDAYGGACVDVARIVMEELDKGEDFDTHKVICDADKKSKSGGITVFVAGCVAQMVIQCHERGNEFRKKWNVSYGVKEEEADKEVVNPAILTIGGG